MSFDQSAFDAFKGGASGPPADAPPDTGPVADPNRRVVVAPDDQKSAERSWSDVPGEAASNFGKSAVQFGKDLVQPILHPIDTAENIGNLAKGADQYSGGVLKYTPPFLAHTLGKKVGDFFTGNSGAPEEDQRPKVDAVGKFLADRYGGMDAIKKTMAEDPVGFLSDLSMIMTGGGSAAARAPGMLGKAGQAVNTAGRVIDPVNAVTGSVGYAAKKAAPVAAEVAGWPSGVGGASVKEAAGSGFEGGDRGKSYRDNMRDNVPMTDAVDTLDAALKEMSAKVGIDYGMYKQTAGLASKQLPSWAPIDNRIRQSLGIQKFHAQDLNKKTAALRKDLNDEILKWKMLDPAIHHTAEGLDALKKLIGNDYLEYATTKSERAVAGAYYNAVKNEIVKLDPNYAKAMENFEKPMEHIREIRQALSGGDRRTMETALRKLNSSLRNNVNTNFGYREKLLDDTTNTVSGKNLKAMVAGQSMNSILPRGMQRAVGGGGLMAALSGIVSPSVFAALATSSPRLVGETVHAAGRAARPLPAIGRAAKKASYPTYQAGRISNAINPEDETEKRYGGAIKAIAKSKAR